MKSSVARKCTIEDIYIGQKSSFDVIITKKTINSFSKLTGDYSPLHTDEEFARRTPFRSRIAQGFLAFSYASALVGMYLPGENATILNHNAKYLKPDSIKTSMASDGFPTTG